MSLVRNAQLQKSSERRRSGCTLPVMSENSITVVFRWWEQKLKTICGSYIRRGPAQGKKQHCNASVFPTIISTAYPHKHDWLSHDAPSQVLSQEGKKNKTLLCKNTKMHIMYMLNRPRAGVFVFFKTFGKHLLYNFLIIILMLHCYKVPITQLYERANV